MRAKLAALTLISAMLVTVAVGTARGGTTWYVSIDTGNDSHSGSASNEPFATIQKAVSVAGRGDSIYIAEGTYLVDDLKNPITVESRAGLKIQGGWNSTFSSRGMVTTVQCPSADALPPAYMSGHKGFSLLSDNAGLAIDGMRVEKCFDGIYVQDTLTKKISIENSTFSKCSNAINVRSGTVFVKGCTFLGNQFGIFGLTGARKIHVTNNKFMNNRRPLHVEYQSGFPLDQRWLIANNYFSGSDVGTTLFYPRADFVNNTLDGQNKGRWGIRVLWAGDVLIANNIIMNFSATTPHLGVGIRGHCGHLTPDLHNNLFHNNSVDTKCTGSNYDPVFDDPLLDGNYRLTGKSPCIDAGFDGSALLQDDLDGDPRSRGTCGDGLYDIGWDEFAGCNDNGTCDPAENCEICPNECAGQKGGNQNDRYCCGNCINETPEGDGTICDGNF